MESTTTAGRRRNAASASLTTSAPASSSSTSTTNDDSEPPTQRPRLGTGNITTNSSSTATNGGSSGTDSTNNTIGAGAGVAGTNTSSGRRVSSEKLATSELYLGIVAKMMQPSVPPSSSASRVIPANGSAPTGPLALVGAMDRVCALGYLKSPLRPRSVMGKSIYQFHPLVICNLKNSSRHLSCL